MGKITTAVLEPGSTIANVYGLWQYSYGQTLRIQGLYCKIIKADLQEEHNMAIRDRP